ncbi:MAG: S9 family peptidase [Bacteroidales bacterium]|nr:S9 family peptidase [Bacteroidales bacterium]
MNIKKLMICMTALALTLASCKKKTEPAEPAPSVIEKPQVTVENGRFTPEVMWALGKMGETALSPDGTQLVYANTYYSMEENKGNAELYLLPTQNEGAAVRLTVTPQNEFNPVWKDDSTLLFARGNEIVSMNIASKAEKVLATVEDGLEGFKLSPDGKQILYISDIKVKRPENLDKLYAGLDKTTGRINEDLMYRHWDNWVDEYPQIFLADMKENGIDIANAVPVLGSEPYECPMRPWGGVEQFNFSPDGKQIAYTCRKKTGKEYALSTNSDIFLYDIATKQTTNLSEGIMGYDQNPVFSHNGKKIAWESMERDGYESDKLRLMVYDFETKELTDYTADFDYGVSGISWSNDDSRLLAVVMYRGTQEIFSFGVADRSIRQVTKGCHDINGFLLAGNDIYATEVSMQHPAEVFRYTADGTEQQGSQFTNINTEVLKQCRMGKTEERWIKTTDGKDMMVWVIYPYDYDSSKTYPALLFCEGGPQSMVGQFWSTRWNFEVMSGAGYFIIAPNRRGCPGFGTAWCEEISGDYGGLCMKDYMQATDVIAKEMPQIDAERIGACGASFGAYSIYWLAGHNYGAKEYNEGRRFKAFLAHNGMFNFEQQCLETEEYWFTNWDLGGPYWEKNAKTAHSYANSPHLFVDKWNTPICVIHSEYDYRIVASQGMAAYNAAKLRGLDARYLYFPDESHWVLKPQNSLLWHRNFIDWFDRWLK